MYEIRHKERLVETSLGFTTVLSASQVDGAKSAVLLGSSPLLSVLTGSSPNIASHMEKNASVATEPARGFFTIQWWVERVEET